MRKMMLLLMLTFCFGFCYAQQKQLDSLLKELKEHPQEDTVRLSLLNQVSYHYQYVDADKGLQTGFQAKQLSEKLKSLSQLGKSYYNIACNYNSLGQDSASLLFCNKTINVKRQLRDSLGLSVVYHLIGIIYYDFGDYTTSIGYHSQALQIMPAIKDKIQYGDILNSMGFDYESLGNYPKALDYHQQALKSYEESSDKNLAAYALGAIGELYNDMSDYSKALAYHNQALKIFQKAGNKIGVSGRYGAIAIVYDEMKDTINARFFLRKQLDLDTEITYEYGIMTAQSNLGISFTNSRNYDSAFIYLFDALEKSRTLHAENNISIVLDYLSYCYIHAPDWILKKYRINATTKMQEAEKLQTESIRNSLVNKNLSELNEAYENLSEIYSAQRQYDKALDAYKKSVIYKDSIIDSDKKQQFTRLEMQYQFTRTQDSIKAITDKQQALAKAEIQKQHILQNAVIAGAGFLLLAAIGGFLFYKRNRDIKLQKNEAVLKQQVTDTEMKALRAQMNPHFIFNSLNSIADYIANNQTKVASDFTAKFAKLMRMVLENSEHKEIPLTDDLKALELYMQLESFRLQNKFDYHIEVDENIDPENTLVPPLILQPFVENSIWHGLAKKEGKGHLTIRIRQAGNMLHCIVEDNGKGMKEAGIAEERKSLGMKITGARIHVINQLKNAGAFMNVANKKEGVRAEVMLPLELSF